VNIALIAHDNKRELMVQFCIAYCGIFAPHSICSTNDTGRLITEATGLKVTTYMSRRQGGIEQIGARIAYNEIDLVLFFADTQSPEYMEDMGLIARLCDQYSIPFASNVATAEVLILGLQRGDLAWRDILNPKKSSGH
jgi:methylglyoxal synthase